MNPIIAELRRNHDKYLKEMQELVAFPSISPGRPHPEAIQGAANWLADRLSAVGLDEVRILEVPEFNPVVWGRKTIDPKLPTVLFYGHYDVMPAEPLDLWHTPPFEATVIDGRVYGRGTADDKGQALMHIAAVEATLKTTGTLPVNVIFAIEGEEEMGSEALEHLLDHQKELFAADIAVISDSPFFADGCPSICYALRGIAAAEVRVTGPNRDLHSGNYGGAVANPAEMLARILNDLKRRDGRITIDGFYDDVILLSSEERAAFAALPFDEARFRADLSIADVYGEDSFSTLERIWARPTLEINGMGSGFQGAGSKTIIPSTAFAKITMRLVAGQDPNKILDLFEKKVREVAPKGVAVTVEKGHTGWPFLAPVDNPYVAAAKRAMSAAFGKETFLIRDGASIPVVNSLARKLGATCLLIGVDVPEGKIHSPNEMFILDNYYTGMETMVLLMDEITKVTGE